MWRKRKILKSCSQKKYDILKRIFWGTVCTVITLIKYRWYIHVGYICGVIQEYIVTKCSSTGLTLFSPRREEHRMESPSLFESVGLSSE